jgi:hypothetical protein
MLELQDPDGRLIVVWRAGRTQFFVYIDGKCEAEFRSGSEAVKFAKSLAVQQGDEPAS